MSRKNKQKKCVNNFNGYCIFGKSKYFSYFCNAKNCSYYVKFNSKLKRRNILKNNKYFSITFIRKADQLLLKICIPIDYKEVSKTIINKYWFNFEYIQKDKYINAILVLNNTESYIKFLFNDFCKDIYVKSGFLYIILRNVAEITQNKTPYNKIRNKININRIFLSEYGKLTLYLKIDKKLVFSSITQLFQNNENTTKNSESNLKTLNNNIYNNKNNNMIEETKTNQSKPQHRVKTIILSYNKKCFNNNHHVSDIIAVLKVATKDKVIDIKKQAVYCPECNQYIMLKTDYKNVKQIGTLLCQVIDKTPEYIAKHKKSTYYGTESKVHSLGYNVIKQGYNYTFKQRKIILANIIENYGITKHEILSMLDTNIARKINLPNYSDAVQKWKQDREFVANYNFGDCPEVIIDEVIIGKR